MRIVRWYDMRTSSVFFNFILFLLRTLKVCASNHRNKIRHIKNLLTVKIIKMTERFKAVPSLLLLMTMICNAESLSLQSR